MPTPPRRQPALLARNSSTNSRYLIPLFVFLILSLYYYTLRQTATRTLDVHKATELPCEALGEGRQVAIIGAGSAGSSAAYYLHKYTESCPHTRVNVTVYERETYIGGRSTVVHAHDHPSFPVELGASIFVKVNHNLMHAVEEFGLSTRRFQSKQNSAAGTEKKDLSDTLGVYDGNTWVYMSPEDSTGGWWTAVALLWQYGWAPIRTQRLMKKTVAKFLKMYSAPFFPFTDLTTAVESVELTETVAVTGETFLNAQGVSRQFSNDIIQASTRVNYAQNLDTIHGVESMVCMAAEGAMAVEGGNWQIFSAMLAAGQANIVLNTTVSRIQATPESKFALSTLSPDGSEEVQSPSYDEIIVAAPLQFSNILFDPLLTQPVPKIPYVELHVTLFASPHPLDPLAFNLPPDSSIPRTILTTETRSHTLPFFSISTLRLITNPHTGEVEYMYKIFSPAPLSQSWLHSILHCPSPITDSFQVITWMHEKIWHSYPVESPRKTFDNITLYLDGVDRRVYYTSPIEQFISTMETSSLMGANVARLIVDEWVDAYRQSHPDAESEVRKDEGVGNGSEL